MTSLKKLSVAILAVLALLSAGCGGDDDDTGTASGSSDSITVYSGRSEELIAPLLEAFTEETGIDVEARYGDSAELALLIDTEGDNSPADVFISQSPGALGYLAGVDRLTELSDDVLSRVDAGFSGSNKTWVGLTGRVRVLVYNSELVLAEELPDSVLDLVAPDFKGRVAVAPTNGSFQDFVTAMRSELGDEPTRDWLAAMGANESPNYSGNSAIVEAVGRGEVDMGLVNHYYNLRALEADPSVPSVNHFFPATDVGALVIVTGAGVLDTSEAPTEAGQLLSFLLSDESQSLFVAETQEYALARDASVRGPEGAPDLLAFEVDSIDFGVLGEKLTETQEMIRDSGIEQ